MNDVSIATEVTSVKTAPTQKKSGESKRTSGLVRNPKLTGKDQEKSETPRREGDEQGEDRDRERFGQAMLHGEKHHHGGKAQGQVSTRTSLR